MNKAPLVAFKASDKHILYDYFQFADQSQSLYTIYCNKRLAI